VASCPSAGAASINFSNRVSLPRREIASLSVMSLQLFANALVVASSYMLVTIGFSLLYRVSRVFDMGYAGVYSAGAYVCYACSVDGLLGGVSAISAAVSLSTVIAIAVEVMVYAPLARRNAPPLVSLLSSLGVFTILSNAIVLLYGSDARFVTLATMTISVGPIVLASTQVAQLSTAVAIIPLAIESIRRTTRGAAMSAVKDDPELAALLGVDAYRVRVHVAGISGALAGLASGMVALDRGVIPGMGFSPVLIGAACAIVAGGRSLSATLLPCLAMALLSTGAVWAFSQQWADPISISVIVVALVIRDLNGKRAWLAMRTRFGKAA
jgi:branched-chain amino acid transport system permease protein